MASIVVTAFFNNSLYNIPYNAGSTFGNSPIYDYPEDTLFTQTPSGNVVGLSLDWGGVYRLGDGNAYFSIGESVSGIELRGISITSPTAGAAATHLIISVNGLDRKIKLLNN